MYLVMDISGQRVGESIRDLALAKTTAINHQQATGLHCHVFQITSVWTTRKIGDLDLDIEQGQ